MAGYPDIRIIAVPYDSGHLGLRMGAGPEHLLDNGLGEALRSEGRVLSVTTVRHEREPAAEVATAFELHGLVSGQVRRALADGEVPLVLSGNCNTSVGTLSGAGPEDLGVVWFDAHGEFNTSETTTTGLIDGMGLAIAVRHCWKAMTKGMPGFSAVPEENVVMAGVREVDPAEQGRLDASGITVVGADVIEKQGLRRALATALDDLKTRVGRVYVHVDLDVLDAGKVGKANEFAVKGGPDAEELQAALGMVRERFEVAAVGIASFDPAFDANERILRVAIASARVLTHPTRPAL
jgi:arginase